MYGLDITKTGYFDLMDRMNVETFLARLWRLVESKIITWACRFRSALQLKAGGKKNMVKQIRMKFMKPRVVGMIKS